MLPHRILCAALAFCALPAQSQAPRRRPAATPTAVIDTTLGRLTCKLLPRQSPAATANFIALAEGTKDWTNPDGDLRHHKRFYDGLTFYNAAAGRSISAGDPLGTGKGDAGFTFDAAIPVDPTFDAPGRLALLGDPGKFSSRFTITLHSDPSRDGKNPIFGQCDARSLKIAGDIAHYLLAAENAPAKPVVINRVSIVRPGQPLPPRARAIASTVPPPPPVVANTPPGPEPTGPTAILETNMGRLTCKLFTTEAPLTTASFLALIQGTKEFNDPATNTPVQNTPFYDGVTFHRVIPDFMIQGGDRSGTGRGKPGFTLPDEIVPNLTFDRPGRLAMANAGPNTSSSQFFISENPLHRLDGHYTIFGQCDDASVKVVAAIARTPRDDKDKPLAPVVIQHASILGEKPLP